LEDAVAHIERLGGKPLSGLIEIPKVGRQRVMLDPQGGMFAIMTPGPRQGNMPEAEPQMGDVAWRELYTSDAPAALQFYTEVFGWEATEPFDMGPTGKYYMFKWQFPLGGMMTKTPQMSNVPTHWGLYFRVPDVEAGTAAVKASGGTVLNGPMNVPTGERIVQCMDPQGVTFSLHQSRP
jgi:uncharacterized protein